MSGGKREEGRGLMYGGEREEGGGLMSGGEGQKMEWMCGGCGDNGAVG